MTKNKDPNIRKNEILDVAQKLLLTKGYAKTTVNDILNVDGLSKGLFYHYFKSKEQVMDAIIQRIVDAEVENARNIALYPDLTTTEKLLDVLSNWERRKRDTKDKQDNHVHLHSVDYAQLRQKSFVQSV